MPKTPSTPDYTREDLSFVKEPPEEIHVYPLSVQYVIEHAHTMNCKVTIRYYMYTVTNYNIHVLR